MKPRARFAAEHPGHVRGHSSRHDRYACLTCDAWVERQCRCAGDRCSGFPDSPERPSMAACEVRQ